MRSLSMSLVLAFTAVTTMAQQKPANPCDPDNGGLTLPASVCANVIGSPVVNDSKGRLWRISYTGRR